MVKTVKTKTNLKVQILLSAPLGRRLHLLGLAGPPLYLPSMWRCLDIHSEESFFQNGVEWDGNSIQNQDHRLQKWGCYWRGKEVKFHSASVQCWWPRTMTCSNLYYWRGMRLDILILFCGHRTEMYRYSQFPCNWRPLLVMHMILSTLDEATV